MSENDVRKCSTIKALKYVTGLGSKIKPGMVKGILISVSPILITYLAFYGLMRALIHTLRLSIKHLKICDCISFYFFSPTPSAAETTA